MEPKKIVIAMDSFKGSATSLELADWLESGIHRVQPDIQVTKIPIADGGEGTIAALMLALNGRCLTVEVNNPLGEATKASLGITDQQVAFIEMAKASGITLIEQTEANALQASSYGLGQLIVAALDQGAKEIYVGIGGSATNDGGVGMAQALGVSFKDTHGQEIAPGAAGLAELATIDISQLDPRVSQTAFHMLSDVANPLTGDNGAIRIYGGQKGLPENRMAEVDGWMQQYRQRISDLVGEDIGARAGAGAAGGVGTALMAFCQADFYQGIDKILELLQVEKQMATANAVITGEGFMDAQSINGKAPIGIAKMAKRYDLPVIAIVGGAADELAPLYEAGIDLVLGAVNRPMTLAEAMDHVKINVINAGETAARALMI